MLQSDVNRLSAILPLQFSWSDAFLYRTYVQAEVASDAFVIDAWSSLLSIPVDCLMSSIVAGDVASAASDTFLFVDMRNDLEISVEVFSRDDVS